MEILPVSTLNSTAVVTNRFTLIVLSALRRSDNENKQVGPHGTGIYTELVIPHSSRVEFISTCSYSINEYKDMVKSQAKPFEDKPQEAESDPKDFADEEPSEDDPSKEDESLLDQTKLAPPAQITPSSSVESAPVLLVTTSPSPLPSSPPFRLSRKRCRSPTPSPTDIPQPPSRMVPPCKRVRDAPAVSSQQDTPAEATDIPSTFETGESLAAIVAQVLLVTCETGEQTIPLLVTRLTRHDEAIDQVYNYLDQMPLEHVDKIDDDIKTLQASLESVEQELVTLRAIVRTLKQHDEVTRESLRIARDRITLLQIEAVVTKQLASDLQDAQVTYRLEITELRRRVEDVDTHFEQSHIRQTSDRSRLQSTEMIVQDVESLCARAEAVEQRAEILQESQRVT
ncbi:hypothetical protein Tco_1252344 [Tanacetum coccineum]